MTPPRDWPQEHTKFLLDYIDVSGETLATPGPRRARGYETLRKRLNTKGIPRPGRAYTIKEINTHCLFLKEQYSAYQGPNLTAFFKNGRAYLSPPLGSAGQDVRETSSETMSAITTPARTNMSPIHGTLRQRVPPRSYYPSRSTKGLSRPKTSREVRRRTLTPLSSVKPASSLNGEMFDVSTDAQIQSIPVPWQDVFYLRSGKCRMSMQSIAPAMIRLKRNAESAVDSYMESADVNELPQPDLEYIKETHQELSEFLEGVIHEKNTSALRTGNISNINLLRSLIARAVVVWVFQDPFPVLGTERGGIWDDLVEILKERGGEEIMDDFENLRLDLQFRLSKKPELIKRTLPSRADELAQRFSGILEPLFLTSNSSGQKVLLLTNKDECTICSDWVPTLRKTFLDALETIIQLRQREIKTEFTWPEPGMKFDGFKLQAENNGTMLDFDRKDVLLTIVPGAFSWTPSDEKHGEMEDFIYYKAAVLLDMDDSVQS